MSLVQVNPFTIPRGRLERAITPAAGLLEHDFDFSARQFTDRVTGIQIDKLSNYQGSPQRDAMYEGDGVAESVIAAVPVTSFLVAPVEPYTVLLEAGSNTTTGIQVLAGVGTGTTPNIGWSIATLSGRATIFTSPDGSAVDICQAPSGVSWPRDGGAIGFVKTGTRLTMYIDGNLIQEVAIAVPGTQAVNGVLGICGSGSFTREYGGTVKRMRMWRGALDDVLQGSQVYAQLGADS